MDAFLTLNLGIQDTVHCTPLLLGRCSKRRTPVVGMPAVPEAMTRNPVTRARRAVDNGTTLNPETPDAEGMHLPLYIPPSCCLYQPI
jgi:hypothetical protein